MPKTIIVTDSHLGPIRNALCWYILKESWGDAVWFGPQIQLVQGSEINGHTLEMLGLYGRTGYNFANHIDALKDKDYSEYKKIMFLGFNDIFTIFRNDHSITETVDKYLDTAVEVFGKKGLVFFTPLVNYEDNMKTLDVHTKYIKYMKESCELKGIECHNIYSIIGQKSQNDTFDTMHLHAKHFLPIYEYLGIL